MGLESRSLFGGPLSPARRRRPIATARVFAFSTELRSSPPALRRRRPVAPCRVDAAELALKSKHAEKGEGPLEMSGPSKPRQRSTLPQGCPCSTIGPGELNFRVRDGNGCDLFGIAARKKHETKCEARAGCVAATREKSFERSSYSTKRHSQAFVSDGAIANGLHLLPARLEHEAGGYRPRCQTSRSSVRFADVGASSAPALGNIGGQAARPISTG